MEICWRGGGAWLGFALALGCQPPAPPRPLPASPRPDKASLYGDPSLIPTRRGEHARAELALAGDLEALVEALEGVLSTRADVTLTPDLALARAVVVVRHERLPQDEGTLKLDVHSIARATLPPGNTAVLLHHVSGEERPADPSRPPLLLAFVSLALGISMGVTAERLAQRRRSRTRS